MNKYLFKALRADNGKWIYGNYVYHELTEEHTILEWSEKHVKELYGEYTFVEVVPETLRMYEGRTPSIS
jgi:hypothetical protein